MKQGGLALVISDKLGKPKSDLDESEDSGEVSEGKVVALEEFGAAMSDNNYAEAAKALESFVGMCRRGGEEE